MVLLGITGPIGHGKTTIAGFMVQQESTSQQIESSEIIAEVADRLNKYFVWDSPSELNLASVNNWLAHLPQILLSVTKSKVDASVLHLELSFADFFRIAAVRDAQVTAEAKLHGQVGMLCFVAAQP